MRVENYLKNKPYPEETFGDKGSKSNGDLMYKGKRFIIFAKERQELIIHDAYEGLGDHPKTKVQHCTEGGTQHTKKYVKYSTGSI